MGGVRLVYRKELLLILIVCIDLFTSKNAHTHTHTVPNSAHEIIQQLEKNSIVCREDFTLVDDFCVARCDSWSQYSDVEKSVTDGLALFAVICVLLGGALFITVSIIYRETMWV